MWIWSARETPTWRPWGIEESDDGDDGHRRGANKRRSHGKCQRIGLIRDSDASWKKHPQFLSLGKLCEDHGKTYHWTSGQKPHLTKNGKKKKQSNNVNYVPFVVPGLSSSSSISSSPFFFNISIAGDCDQHGESSNRKKWDHEDFKENLVDKNVQPHQYSPSPSHELPMEPASKCGTVARVSTVSILTSRKTEFVTSAWGLKLQGLHAEDVLV